MRKWRSATSFQPYRRVLTFLFVICVQTIYYHFRRWRLDGRLRRAHDRLREEVRLAQGRDRDPSAAVIDSQVVKTARAGGPERGYDGAKRLAGRKRHILVDTNALVLAACVHGADLPDRDGGRRLLAEGLRPGLPRMELVWADGAYTAGFREWAELELGWRVEVPYQRDRQLWRYGLEEKPRGFRVLPRRWVEERTFAWLSQVRRLSKDYERLPEVAEAMIYGAISRIMLRRLAKGAARRPRTVTRFAVCKTLSQANAALTERIRAGTAV